MLETLGLIPRTILKKERKESWTMNANILNTLILGNFIHSYISPFPIAVTKYMTLDNF